MHGLPAAAQFLRTFPASFSVSFQSETSSKDVLLRKPHARTLATTLVFTLVLGVLLLLPLALVVHAPSSPTLRRLQGTAHVPPLSAISSGKHHGRAAEIKPPSAVAAQEGSRFSTSVPVLVKFPVGNVPAKFQMPITLNSTASADTELLIGHTPVWEALIRLAGVLTRGMALHQKQGHEREGREDTLQPSHTVYPPTLAWRLLLGLLGPGPHSEQDNESLAENLITDSRSDSKPQSEVAIYPPPGPWSQSFPPPISAALLTSRMAPAKGEPETSASGSPHSSTPWPASSPLPANSVDDTSTQQNMCNSTLDCSVLGTANSSSSAHLVLGTTNGNTWGSSVSGRANSSSLDPSILGTWNSSTLDPSVLGAWNSSTLGPMVSGTTNSSTLETGSDERPLPAAVLAPDIRGFAEGAGIPGTRVQTAEEARVFRKEVECKTSHGQWVVDPTPRLLPWPADGSRTGMCDERWIRGGRGRVAGLHADAVAGRQGSPESWQVRPSLKFVWKVDESKCGVGRHIRDVGGMEIVEKLLGVTRLKAGSSSVTSTVGAGAATPAMGLVRDERGLLARSSQAANEQAPPANTGPHIPVGNTAPEPFLGTPVSAGASSANPGSTNAGALDGHKAHGAAGRVTAGTRGDTLNTVEATPGEVANQFYSGTNNAMGTTEAHRRNGSARLILVVGDSMQMAWATSILDNLRMGLPAGQAKMMPIPLPSLPCYVPGGMHSLLCWGVHVFWESQDLQGVKLVFVRNDFLSLVTSQRSTRGGKNVELPWLMTLEKLRRQMQNEGPPGVSAEPLAFSSFNAPHVLPPVLLLNRGAHFSYDRDFFPELNATMHGIRAACPRCLLIFRNTPPGHKGCQHLKVPLANRQMDSGVYSWGAISRQSQNPELRRLVEASGGIFLDVETMTSLRGDGHVVRNRRGREDCLHYCAPGPVDFWTKLLFHVLAEVL